MPERKTIFLACEPVASTMQIDRATRTEQSGFKKPVPLTKTTARPEESEKPKSEKWSSRMGCLVSSILVATNRVYGVDYN